VSRSADDSEKGGQWGVEGAEWPTIADDPGMEFDPRALGGGCCAAKVEQR
jgi:hypothetical protein